MSIRRNLSPIIVFITSTSLLSSSHCRRGSGDWRREWRGHCAELPAGRGPGRGLPRGQQPQHPGDQHHPALAQHQPRPGWVTSQSGETSEASKRMFIATYIVCDIKWPCDAIGTIVHLIIVEPHLVIQSERYYRLWGDHALCSSSLFNWISTVYSGLDNYSDPFSWLHIPPMIQIVTYFNSWSWNIGCMEPSKGFPSNQISWGHDSGLKL